MFNTNQIEQNSFPVEIEWREFLETRVKTKRPRLLLVDDDPVFCHSMKKTAEKNNIDLKICQNFGEVMGLSKEAPFDAAVLDFQFGDLTALQVGHFLSEDTPIVITSSHHRSTIHTTDWPFDIRDFVAKSRGNMAILKSALGIRMGTKTPSVVSLDPPASLANWLLLAAVSIVLSLLLTLSFLTPGTVY